MKHTLLAFLCFGTLLQACGASRVAGKQSGLVSQGSAVPALSRMDHRGKVVALRAQVPTLVYFYPKDGTPGCTREACALRDAWEEYEAAGLRVIGVSADAEQRHRAFAEEQRLPFSLIADPEHAWSKAFGVSTFGDKDERVSFLIDAKDHIAKVYKNVDPGVHAAEVLRDAKALSLVASGAGR